MLTGKGIYLWRVRDCEGGDIPTIVERAKDAKLSHIIIKIAESVSGYNYVDGVDKAFELSQALVAEGIEPWGYQFVYGVDPIGEALTANRRMRETGCVGFVINAEMQYRDLPNNKVAAITYMDKLDFSEPKALSTFRYPEVHPKFPYREFLDGCDLNMPQVYWMQATNSEEQLVECLYQYASFDSTPIIPTGSAFCEHGWCATSGEVNRFSRKVQELELQGVNYWEWAATRNAGLWPVVRDFVWEETEPPVEPPPVDCCEELEQRVATAINLNTNELINLDNLQFEIGKVVKANVARLDEIDPIIGVVSVIAKENENATVANATEIAELEAVVEYNYNQQVLDADALEGRIEELEEWWGFDPNTRILELTTRVKDLENKTIPQTNHSHWWQRLFK